MAKKRGRPIDPQNRIKILNAAIELFIEKGFESATVPEFSKRAGVSSSSMYTYWQSKEDVLESAVEQVLRENYTMVFDLLRKTQESIQVEERLEMCLDLIASMRSRSLFIIRSIATPGMEDRMSRVLVQVNSDFRKSTLAFPNLKLSEADLEFTANTIVAIINSYYLYGNLDVTKKTILRLLHLLSKDK